MYNKRLSNDEKLVPLSSPRTLAPYMSTRDCSQGFCSFYCPQWCYIIFPPPPQFDLPDDDDDSSPNFSPLVIAIIGILASAFLLVSYYTIVSKYCGNSRRESHHQEESELEEEDHDPSNHEAWNVNAGGGLDEALIKSITVFKYKKCDGLLTEGTDCSVCLSEFQEDESLRLLPKCSHAFHVMCIDTWLKSHSNCPLCRAQITFSNASPPPLPPPVMEATREIVTTPPIQPERDIEMGMIRVEEARDEEEKEEDVTYQNHMNQEVRRRSLSMDYASQRRLSIADVLRIDHDEFHDCVTGEDCELQRDVGTSKQENNGEEMSKGGFVRNNSLVQCCVTSPMMMKRSLSSGRFLFTKCGRGQNMAIPLSNV